MYGTPTWCGQKITGETTMISSTKIAFAFAILVGLAAVAIGELDSRGDGSGVAGNASVNAESDGSERSAPVSSVCNILYPTPCAVFGRW
jgi:hypothetical protein